MMLRRLLMAGRGVEEEEEEEESAARRVGYFLLPLLRSVPQARRATLSDMACVSISGCSTLRGARGNSHQNGAEGVVVEGRGRLPGRLHPAFYRVFFCCSRCRSNMIAKDAELAWWSFHRDPALPQDRVQEEEEVEEVTVAFDRVAVRGADRGRCTARCCCINLPPFRGNSTLTRSLAIQTLYM